VPMYADVLYNPESMRRLQSAPMNEREIIKGLVDRLHERVIQSS